MKHGWMFFVLCIFSPCLAYSTPQKRIFNVESINYGPVTGSSVCNMMCSNTSNESVDIFINKGWEVVSSSPKEIVAMDKHINSSEWCMCIGTEYLIKKAISKNNSDVSTDRPSNRQKDKFDPSRFYKSPKTVKDMKTGLTWMINPSNDNVDFEGAMEAVRKLNADGFSGFNDWRLPTKDELEILFDFNNYESKNILSDYFWSSTIEGSNNSSAWVINFQDGYKTVYSKKYHVRVWPVRSAKTVKNVAADLSNPGMKKKNSKFRSKLKIGDSTNCGLVITINRPLAKIQTKIGEKWLRLDQLYPKDQVSCDFYDGEYVGGDQ